MTLPVWILLAFAGWTLLTLLSTIGIYRWRRILTGRTAISDWDPAKPQGSDWYRRALRAHMNCVENLPVYGAIAVAIIASGAAGPALDGLAIAFMIARVCQTTVHVATTPTDLTAAIRFGFFFAQLVCMIAMGAIVAVQAL